MCPLQVKLSITKHQPNLDFGYSSSRNVVKSLNNKKLEILNKAKKLSFNYSQYYCAGVRKKERIITNKKQLLSTVKEH